MLLRRELRGRDRLVQGDLDEGGPGARTGRGLVRSRGGGAREGHAREIQVAELA